MGLVRRYGFNIEAGQSYESLLKRGVRKGSKGLKSVGESLRIKSILPEDHKASKTKIFDPQDRSLQLWNRIFLVSCLLAVSCDPLLFYLPFIDDEKNCLDIDGSLAANVTTLRTLLDAFYVTRIVFQFRTAFVAPSSRVFGRGELVIDPDEIGKRYIRRGRFFIDVMSVLPLPQVAVWRYLVNKTGVWETKVALLFIIFIQYIPRFIRIFPLQAELKKTVGVFAESAFVGSMYYLMLMLLSSHIVGSFWYLLAVQRNIYCWEVACLHSVKKCRPGYLYCGNHYNAIEKEWRNISEAILKKACSLKNDDIPDPNVIKFGIYRQALEADLFSKNHFISKYFYCLWFGLQNLTTLGQGLRATMSEGEVGFSMAIAIFGLVLFALLVGNMQTYLQSLTLRVDEMRLKRRDSELWMHHRALPQDLRERVRRYDLYKWMETRGVDEQSLVQNLPKDLRRDIKRNLCLDLVRRVPLFANMDQQLLDAICERLKPSLYTENTFVVREGDPVNEILFVIRGKLESETTDGGRTGFYNRSILKEGDFCGDELLTWALDPRTGTQLPSSTRTVKSLTEVEAFAISSEEMKFVTNQFRRLHSRQVQQTFRFYSQQWRTWAARYIQAAWRRYTKRKMELRRMEEEETSLNGSALGATIYASRFASNALRGVRNRVASTRQLVLLQKPQELDFNSGNTD